MPETLFNPVPLTPAGEIVLEELAEISLAAERGGATNEDIANAHMIAFYRYALRSARKNDFVAICTALTTGLQRATGQMEN